MILITKRELHEEDDIFTFLVNPSPNNLNRSEGKLDIPLEFLEDKRVHTKQFVVQLENGQEARITLMLQLVYSYIEYYESKLQEEQQNIDMIEDNIKSYKIMLSKLHQLFPAMRQEQAIVPSMEYIASKNKDLPKQAISQPLAAEPVELQYQQIDFPESPDSNQSPWGRVNIKPGQFVRQPDAVGSFPTSHTNQSGPFPQGYPRGGVANSNPQYVPKPLTLTPGMGPKPSGQSNFMNNGSYLGNSQPGPGLQGNAGYGPSRIVDGTASSNPYYQPAPTNTGLRDAQSLGFPAEYRDTPPSDLTPLITSGAPRASRGK